MRWLRSFCVSWVDSQSLTKLSAVSTVDPVDFGRVDRRPEVASPLDHSLRRGTLLRFTALLVLAMIALASLDAPAQIPKALLASSSNGGVLVVAPFDSVQGRELKRLYPGLPSDTRNEPVDFGQELRVWTVWYLDTYNCTSLGTGTITASQGPHWGTNRFDVEDATLPPGYPCEGYTLPANFAFYTWTIQPQNTVFDFFHLHYVSNDQTQVGDVDRAPELVGKGVGDCCSSTQSGSAPVGDPISVGNGNVYEKVVDYQTAGQNKLSFIRYYNSLGVPNTFASSLGVNWRFNYDRYVNIVSPNIIVVERPDGQLLNFTPSGQQWVADSDVDYVAVPAGSTWSVTDHDDTVETYQTISQTQALLQTIKARNGYTQTLHYNAGNLLESVSDSYGRQLVFTYNGNALQTVTTPDGLVLSYAYNTIVGGINNQLASVSYNTTPVTKQVYHYDNSSLPFSLTGVDDENGNRYTTWTYDSLGRGTSSTQGSNTNTITVTYNDNDGSRQVQNAYGVIDTYAFSVLQGIPKVTQISRGGSVPAATRQFTYDSNGYLASVSDWNGNQTSFVNDTHGQPTRITEPTRTTTISYDGTWPHLPHNIVTSGLTTSFSYDHHTGEILYRKETDTTTQTVPYPTNGTVEEWQYTWQNALLASLKTPLGNVTQFIYDSLGALEKVTNPLGQQINITSNTGGGLPLTIVDANSVTTTLAYDQRLRLSTSTLHTAAGNRTTTYNHDAAGNLQSVELSDGSGLNYSYDTAHRLTGVTDLAGQTISYSLDQLGDPTLIDVKDAHGTITRNHSADFDPLGRVLQDIGGVQQTTVFTYDSNGNVLTVTDPLNDTTTHVFDALNRLTKSTDPNGHDTRITYDNHDRRLTITDPNSGATSYIYDGFGDVIQQASPDSGTSVFYYDLGGNLTKRVAGTGAVSQYTYDALERLHTIKFPADPAENVTYTYDNAGHGFGIGRLTNVSDASGSLSVAYDERANVTQETRTIGSVQLRTYYSYNPASRLSSITYPSGAVVRYTYNSRGEAVSVTAQPHSGSSVPVLSSVSYEAFGPVRAMTYGNHVVDNRSFDLDYRMKTIHDLGTDYLQKLGYSYDAADNLKTISEAVNPDNNQGFAYDVLNRLITASGPYGHYSWTYSKMGGRATETLAGSTTTYHYGTHDNQLLSLSVNGTTTQRFGYTADGNANAFSPGILSPGGERITGLNYNQAGQLAAVISGSEPLGQYSYDGFGQRTVKTLSATSGTLYQYDRMGRLLEEADAHGNPQVDYVYLNNLPVGTISPSTEQVYFLHTDRLGTPQLATDNGQNVVWNAGYLPFGGTSWVQGTITQNLRYPGQQFDPESGWNHNGFRNYAVSWGRYLETDPIGLRGGLNTYIYAFANPLVLADPEGLCPCEGQKLEEAESPISAPTNVQNALTVGQDVGTTVLSWYKDPEIQKWLRVSRIPFAGLGVINSSLSAANLARDHSFGNAFDFAVSVGSVIPDSPIAQFSLGMSLGKAGTLFTYWVSCKIWGQEATDNALINLGNNVDAFSSTAGSGVDDALSAIGNELGVE